MPVAGVITSSCTPSRANEAAVAPAPGQRAHQPALIAFLACQQLAPLELSLALRPAVDYAPTEPASGAISR